MIASRKTYFYFFRTLLIPYLILILLLSVMGAILYVKSVRLTADQIRQQNVSLLQDAEYSLRSMTESAERLLAYLSSVASSLQFDSSIDPTVRADRRELSAELFAAYSSGMLPPAGAFHDSILNYFILIEEPAVIVNNEVTLPLDTYLRYGKGLTEEANRLIQSYLLDHSTTEQLVELASLVAADDLAGGTTRMAMVRRFGRRFGGTSGVIILYFDEDTLARSIRNIDVSDGGAVFVLNGKNEIQLSYRAEEYDPEYIQSGVLGKDQIQSLHADARYFVTVHEPELLTWQFVAVQSRHFLAAETREIRTTIVVAISSLLILGVAFSLVVVSLSSRSASKMYLELQGPEIPDVGRQDRWWVDIFSLLDANVQTLSSHLARQADLIRDSLLTKTLNGYELSEGERDELMHTILHRDADRYTVLILSSLDDEDRLWTARAGLFLESLGFQAVRVLSMNPKEIVLIHQGSQEECEIFRASLEEFHREIMAATNIAISVYAGGPVGSVDDIHISYEHACLMRDANSDDRNRVYRYELEDREGEPVFLPQDFEQRLSGSVLGGDEQSVARLLGDARRVNFREYKASLPYIRVVLGSVLAVLVNAAHRTTTPDRTLAERVDQLVRRETTIQNYEELFAEAEELLRLIIHTRKSMKENRQSRLAAEIKEIVDEEFDNSLLSSNLVAQRLEISGNYVFKLFRKFYGTTFQRHVETVRMEHAQTRLSAGDRLSVKDIAVESGYSSITTFYKAFKKHFGVSASEYRRQAERRYQHSLAPPRQRQESGASGP